MRLRISDVHVLQKLRNMIFSAKGKQELETKLQSDEGRLNNSDEEFQQLKQAWLDPLK